MTIELTIESIRVSLRNYQRVVILRVFVKKTQKTPPRELAIARQRAKDVT